MTVEAATYISDLNTSLPASGDGLNEADDQFRMIKTVLKTNTFPNITGAVTSSHTELNMLDGLTGTVLTTTNYATSPPSGGWVLMNSTPVTAVAAIDFKTGTGGVTISNDYDEYLFVLDQVWNATAGSDLRMEFSTDGGSTFAAGTATTQILSIAGGIQADTQAVSQTYVPLCSTTTRNPSSVVAATNAVVRISRPVGSTDKVFGVVDYVFNAGDEAGTNYFVADNGTSRFDAVRFNWSGVDTFAANGTIKMFARKV